MDSGASVHMTPNKKFFNSFVKFDEIEIAVADNTKLRTESKGEVTVSVLTYGKISNIIIKDVVSEFEH